MTRHITAVDASDVMALAAAIVSKRGIFWFRSRGFSMEPWIGNGELVAIGAVAIDQIRPGDVLLCHTAGTPILHRVSQRVTGAFDHLVLKSDVGNQVHAVTAEQVVGKVVAVKRSPVRLLGWFGKKALRDALHRLGVGSQIANTAPRPVLQKF